MLVCFRSLDCSMLIHNPGHQLPTYLLEDPQEQVLTVQEDP